MPAPKDPEKRKLWIERMSTSKTGKNHPMYGKKNPKLTERNRQQTGNKNPMFGIKNPALAERNRQRTGINNPRYGKKDPALSERNRQRKGEKRSKETIEKMSGKNHPNFGKRGAETSGWKDGATILNRLIRSCFLYTEWRLMVYGRDDFTCQECYARGVYLHAHHKKLFSIILEQNNITSLKQAEQCAELWNINNGITLCKKCHKKIHRKEE